MPSSRGGNIKYQLCTGSKRRVRSLASAKIHTHQPSCTERKEKKTPFEKRKVCRLESSALAPGLDLHTDTRLPRRTSSSVSYMVRRWFSNSTIVPDIRSADLPPVPPVKITPWGGGLSIRTSSTKPLQDRYFCRLGHSREFSSASIPTNQSPYHKASCATSLPLFRGRVSHMEQTSKRQER